MLLIKPGYYKATKKRNVGRLLVHLHFHLRADGTIKVIDITRSRVYFNKSFGTLPIDVTKSNKTAFTKALAIFLNK